MIARRRSVIIAFGSALLAAAFRWRGAEAKPTFVERTPPGNRYRTLAVGAQPVHVREDLIAGGWYRDFQAHRKEGGGK